VKELLEKYAACRVSMTKIPPGIWSEKSLFETSKNSRFVKLVKMSGNGPENPLLFKRRFPVNQKRASNGERQVRLVACRMYGR
jgi:hypothetical protein